MSFSNFLLVWSVVGPWVRSPATASNRDQNPPSAHATSISPRPVVAANSPAGARSESDSPASAHYSRSVVGEAARAINDRWCDDEIAEREAPPRRPPCGRRRGLFIDLSGAPCVVAGEKNARGGVLAVAGVPAVDHHAVLRAEAF